MSHAVSDIIPRHSSISRLIELAIDELDPLEIWLFGSRAKGLERPDSDWDLLLVIPDDRADAIESDIHLAYRLRRATEADADVVACSATDFRLDADVPNTLGYEVARTGRRVYRRAD